MKAYAQNPTLPGGYYNSVALSGSGQYQALAQRAESDDTTCPTQAALLTSCDFGRTWTTRLSGQNFV